MKIYVVYDSEGEHTKKLAEAIAEGAGNMMLQTCGSIMSARRILESSKKWTLSSGDARAISVQSAPD